MNVEIMQIDQIHNQRNIILQILGELILKNNPHQQPLNLMIQDQNNRTPVVLLNQS